MTVAFVGLFSGAGLLLLPHWTEVAVALVGAFVGIATLSSIDFLALDQTDLSSLIGSFGASAVLLYGAPASPLAQPRYAQHAKAPSALYLMQVD